jgi:hypothetical protein
MESVESGCLTQHSQFDRLREVADGWARDRLSGAAGDPAGLAVSLIILGSEKDVLTADIDELHLKGSAMGDTRPGATERPAYTRLLVLESVRRILQVKRPTAAALLARLSETSLGLQIADLDHEQSLTAQLIKQPDSTLTVGKWDFARVSWSVRLRPLLQAIPRPGQEEPAATRLRTKPAAERVPTLVTAGASRDEHIRELREQLGDASAAAPSWLQ